MTNNDIVEEVYRTYKLKTLITNLICNSRIDGSYEDLEQYVYLILLKMNNKTINRLYDTGIGLEIDDPRNELRSFISRIIINQRNLSKKGFKSNEYNKYKLNSCEFTGDEIENEDYDYDYDLDRKTENDLIWLRKELNRYELTTGLTNDEINIQGYYRFMKLKLNRNYTVSQLAKHMNCSIGKVVMYLRYARKNIKKNYDDTFNNVV